MNHLLEELESVGFTEPWSLLLLVLIGILGVGRLARLITYDEFPPAVAWRIRWARITHDGPWTKLFTCYWCLTPWLVLISAAVFVLSWNVFWLAWIWLGFHLWFAVSYVTSMIVNRDERD